MKKLINYALSASSIFMFTLTACQKEESIDGSSPTTSENERTAVCYPTTFYALAGGIQLDRFTSSNPQSVTNSATISGLQTGETILAIDFRPATGQLYGIGSTSRLYVINPLTGVARMIGANPLSPALTGSLAGFDFNPTVDRIRIVTSSGQNLRVNPESGAVAFTDVSINGQAGAMISGVAYANNTAGAVTTTLFDIDPVSNNLFKQDPPNNGTLVSVGPLNLNVDDEGGFDISPLGDAFAIYKVNNISTLFSVNLNTGAAHVKATYPNTLYTAIAIPTNSVAYAVNPTNNLLIFGLKGTVNNTNTITKPITGLAPGENIVGLDMRPLNGQLYALGSNSSIYTINASSGLATLAYTLTTALSGTSFGFDFNPAVDRIRIVSNTGQNLRFNPNDGVTLIDVPLNPGSPSISAAAYNNNVAGTLTTSLFTIDYTNDKFYQVNPPNGGTLVLIGNLGANAPSGNGFDIGGTSGKAFALFKYGNLTRVYNINTATGQATSVGSLGNNIISGFTIGLGF